MDDAQRVAQTRDMMEERDIDLLAIPASDDLRYLTGFSPLADERPCYLFLSDRAGLFLIPHHQDNARAALKPLYAVAVKPEAWRLS